MHWCWWNLCEEIKLIYFKKKFAFNSIFDMFLNVSHVCLRDSCVCVHVCKLLHKLFGSLLLFYDIANALFNFLLLHFTSGTFCRVYVICRMPVFRTIFLFEHKWLVLVYKLSLRKIHIMYIVKTIIYFFLSVGGEELNLVIGP